MEPAHLAEFGNGLPGHFRPEEVVKDGVGKGSAAP